MRREEVTTLNMGDYDSENGKLFIQGKRSKQRIVYLMGGATVALQDWTKLRGTGPGPLFLSVNKAGRVVYGR